MRRLSVGELLCYSASAIMVVGMPCGCSGEHDHRKTQHIEAINSVSHAATNQPYDASFSLREFQPVSVSSLLRTNVFSSSAFAVISDSNPPSRLLASVVLQLWATPEGQKVWVPQRRLTYEIQGSTLRLQEVAVNTRLADSVLPTNDVAQWTDAWSDTLKSRGYAIPLEDIQRATFILQDKHMAIDSGLPPHTLNVHDLLVLLADVGFSSLDPANTARLAIWKDEEQISLFRIFCSRAEPSSSLTIDAAPNFSGEPFSSRFQVQAALRPENKDAMSLLARKIHPALTGEVARIFSESPSTPGYTKTIDNISLKLVREEDSGPLLLNLSTIPGPYEPQQVIGVWSEEVRQK